MLLNKKGGKWMNEWMNEWMKNGWMNDIIKWYIHIFLILHGQTNSRTKVAES